MECQSYQNMLKPPELFITLLSYKTLPDLALQLQMKSCVRSVHFPETSRTI